MSIDRSYIAGNSAQRERLRALIARLNDEDLARPMSDGWTIAALLAHMAFWDLRASALLHRWEQEGVGPSPVDPEALNYATKPYCLLLAPRVAAQLALDTAEAVDRTLETISDDLVIRIIDSDLNPKRSTHRSEHLDEIERALA